jgi:antitoxin ParD1/3/4
MKSGIIKLSIAEQIVMNISLTPELERLIQEQVKKGRYSSVSEMVGESLRLLWERDRIREKRVAELRQKIQVGIEELNRGEGIDGEEVFDEIEADIRRIEAQMQATEEVR